MDSKNSAFASPDSIHGYPNSVQTQTAILHFLNNCYFLSPLCQTSVVFTSHCLLRCFLASGMTCYLPLLGHRCTGWVKKDAVIMILVSWTHLQSDPGSKGCPWHTQFLHLDGSFLQVLLFKFGSMYWDTFLWRWCLLPMAPRRHGVRELGMLGEEKILPSRAETCIG